MDFRFYEVAGVKASFADGYVLKLSSEQVRKRVSCLQEIGDGAFKVLRAVEFKKGEKIGVAGDHSGLNKAMLIDLTEIDERAARKLEKERKAEAQAKASLPSARSGFMDKAKSFVGLGGSAAPAASDALDIPPALRRTESDAEEEAPVE